MMDQMKIGAFISECRKAKAVRKASWRIYWG